MNINYNRHYSMLTRAEIPLKPDTRKIMKNFYVTFGQQYRREPHPHFPDCHPDGWLAIQAKDYDTAREFAMNLLQGQFSTMYDEQDFKPIHFPKGELELIILE